MKTPREILLERHRAAAPKLDAIRQSIVSEELNNQATKEQSRGPIFVSVFLCCSNAVWCELIWPSRRIWAGLAAIWIFIFIVNISQRDHPSVTMVKSSATPEMISSFRQQEKILAELIGQNEPPIASPRRQYSPPSSQRQFEVFTI